MSSAIRLGVEQFRRVPDAHFARMLSRSSQFPAVQRTQTRGKSCFQFVGLFRQHRAGGVQRATEAVRRAATPKGLEVGDGQMALAGEFLKRVQHGLRAVQTMRRLAENGEGSVFHAGLDSGSYGVGSLAGVRGS